VLQIALRNSVSPNVGEVHGKDVLKEIDQLLQLLLDGHVVGDDLPNVLRIERKHDLEDFGVDLLLEKNRNVLELDAEADVLKDLLAAEQDLLGLFFLLLIHQVKLIAWI